MAYLSEVKTELKELFDDAFKAAWEMTEKALKQSYKNGVKAGQNPSKGNGDKPAGEKSNRFARKPKEEGDEEEA